MIKYWRKAAAYCRFLDSEVYMYLDLVDYKVACVACLLQKKSNGFDLRRKSHPHVGGMTFQEAIAHLEAHRAAGHDVPDEAFEELRRDIALYAEDPSL